MFNYKCFNVIIYCECVKIYERKMIMKKVLKFLLPYWYIAIFAPIFMIIEVLADLMQPKFLSQIVENGIKAGNMSVIYIFSNNF